MTDVIRCARLDSTSKSIVSSFGLVSTFASVDQPEVV
ncbi:hypothetical protein BKA12_000918 [Neomicrococcus lactis]|uniref:Uncharacterized protein n=1 Tax=Neomicrococcus lactis TaxID=732241 RepID=A0A7W8YA93_9MICC|nr:hypothetical protein [Neomicrococcus lactis]